MSEASCEEEIFVKKICHVSNVPTYPITIIVIDLVINACAKMVENKGVITSIMAKIKVF